jgi:hypothetical protein
MICCGTTSRSTSDGPSPKGSATLSPITSVSKTNTGGPTFPPRCFQDDRAFFDFMPVVQFNGAEGVRQLYQTIATAFPDLHIEGPAYDVPGCSSPSGLIS